MSLSHKVVCFVWTVAYDRYVAAISRISVLFFQGNSMQHIGATSSVMRSESQVSLNKRRESDVTDKSGAQKTVTGWEEVPRGMVPLYGLLV